MRYIQWSSVLLILLLSAWHPVLAAALANGQQKKTINFGVEGQGIDLQNLYARSLTIRRSKPDIVRY